jgi:hypothetical protein
VLQVTAGPRWNEDTDDTRGDVELALELPWRKRSAARRRLVELFDEAATVLPAAAAATAALELRHTYVDAWRAQELLALREEVQAAALRLAEIARSREAAGADPPFEAQLASLEVDEAASAVAAARSAMEEAWLRLAALAEVPEERPPLAEPVFLRSSAAASAAESCDGTTASGADPGSPPDSARRSATWRAELLRAELATARSELDLDAELSRFSWVGSVAREGREDVARLGLALELPRGGVQASRREATAADVASARRASELSSSQLAARWVSATALLRSTPAAGVEDPRFASTLAAIEARLAAGRASPAETLTLRRQVLALREQALERAALREHATAELIALCTPATGEDEEVTP